MGGRLPETIRVFYLTHEYRPEFESVAKEIASLRNSFSGTVYELDNLTRRGNKYTRRINRCLPYLLEKTCHISHIYYPRLLDFSPILYLRKPKVYSVVARYLGYPNREEMRNAVPIIEMMDQVVTADFEDEEILHEWGLNNVQTILPGVEIDKFEYGASHSKSFKILMASSPWVPQQIEEKGIGILLDAVKELSTVDVIFLWRGVCLQEMKDLIRFKEVKDKVSVINEAANVPFLMKEINTTIAPFRTYENCRAYPTSIIESLAAGKPVIVSDQIPISAIIEREECGVVVKPTKEGIVAGFENLRLKYQQYQKNCIRTAQKYFSHKRLLRDYAALYQKIIYGKK